jgi:hypothetical protein
MIVSWDIHVVSKYLQVNYVSQKGTVISSYFKKPDEYM